MKFLNGFLLLTLLAVFLCGAGFVVGYVTIVALSIPQLPAWAQPGVTEWLFDIPQDSEHGIHEGGSAGTGPGVVGWDDYVGPEGDIRGLPLWGPVRRWSDWYDKPLLGCVFHDPNYSSHVGSDFPVYPGTPVHATMGGKVVWAGTNGPWGNLVVIQNGDYQVWYAHLDAVHVTSGQIVGYGDILGLSGDTGNSTGPHLHYGIKHKTGEDSYVWLDPHLFFSADEYIKTACSD